MNGGADAAMRDAIDLCKGIGREDLASDIDRILAAIDFEEIEILRHPDADSLANDIVEAETHSELADALQALSRLLHVDHCTIHVVREVASTNFRQRVLTTYPNEWAMRYVERRYFTVDPVLR